MYNESRSLDDRYIYLIVTDYIGYIHCMKLINCLLWVLPDSAESVFVGHFTVQLYKLSQVRGFKFCNETCGMYRIPKNIGYSFLHP